MFWENLFCQILPNLLVAALNTCDSVRLSATSDLRVKARPGCPLHINRVLVLKYILTILTFLKNFN